MSTQISGDTGVSQCQPNSVSSDDIQAGAVTTDKLSQKLTLATAQATTSGTFKDFLDVPSWAKRITIGFSSVSLSGTASMVVQLGSGSIDASSYGGSSSSLGVASMATSIISTSFAFVDQSAAAGDSRSGHLILTTIGSNIWTASGMLGKGNTNYMILCAGTKTLAGTLDRVRITTSNGTDTFDAGSVNILYEG